MICHDWVGFWDVLVEMMHYSNPAPTPLRLPFAWFRFLVLTNYRRSGQALWCFPRSMPEAQLKRERERQELVNGFLSVKTAEGLRQCSMQHATTWPVILRNLSVAFEKKNIYSLLQWSPGCLKPATQYSVPLWAWYRDLWMPFQWNQLLCHWII